MLDHRIGSLPPGCRTCKTRCEGMYVLVLPHEPASQEEVSEVNVEHHNHKVEDLAEKKLKQKHLKDKAHPYLYEVAIVLVKDVLEVGSVPAHKLNLVCKSAHFLATSSALGPLSPHSLPWSRRKIIRLPPS